METQTKIDHGVGEVVTKDEIDPPWNDPFTLNSDEETEEEDYSLSSEEETNSENEVAQLPSESKYIVYEEQLELLLLVSMV